MSKKNLQSAGDIIEQEMTEILKSIGGSLGKCEINTADLVDYGSAEDVWTESLEKPWEPFIVNGEYMILYIKDNSLISAAGRPHAGYKRHHDIEVREHPNRCYESGRKVHFYRCTTLQTAPKERREARYFQDRLDKYTRIIDLRDARVKTKLAWCKHCIGRLSKGVLWQWLSGDNKSRIAEYGRPGDIVRCVKLKVDNTHESKEEVRKILKQMVEDRG